MRGVTLDSKLIFSGVCLVVAFLLVRTVAPMVQEWGWQQEAYADRVKSERALLPSVEPMPVDKLVQLPIGMLMAASACNDPGLEARVENALLVFGKKFHPDHPDDVKASVAASVSKAKAADPTALQEDCRRTLRMATAAISEWEK